MNLESNGFVVVSALLSPEEVDVQIRGLSHFIEASRNEASVLKSRGAVYGTRNLEVVFPDVLRLVSHPRLSGYLQVILGSGFGLVRAIYFDKPPEQTWSLPWHKDVHIAVKQAIPADGFKGPTIKAGVPHLEAPVSLLERMITARIHLDEVTMENGPLEVRPGSHLTGNATEHGPDPEYILTPAGGMLLMRPLLDHRSGPSKPGGDRHRRILHLEFAPAITLPGGLQWNLFHTRL